MTGDDRHNGAAMAARALKKTAPQARHRPADERLAAEVVSRMEAVAAAQWAQDIEDGQAWARRVLKLTRKV